MAKVTKKTNPIYVTKIDANLDIIFEEKYVGGIEGNRTYTAYQQASARYRAVHLQLKNGEQLFMLDAPYVKPEPVSEETEETSADA